MAAHCAKNSIRPWSLLSFVARCLAFLASISSAKNAMLVLQTLPAAAISHWTLQSEHAMRTELGPVDACKHNLTNRQGCAACQVLTLLLAQLLLATTITRGQARRCKAEPLYAYLYNGYK